MLTPTELKKNVLVTKKQNQRAHLNNTVISDHHCPRRTQTWLLWVRSGELLHVTDIIIIFILFYDDFYLPISFQSALQISRYLHCYFCIELQYRPGTLQVIAIMKKKNTGVCVPALILGVSRTP